MFCSFSLNTLSRNANLSSCFRPFVLSHTTFTFISSVFAFFFFFSIFADAILIRSLLSFLVLTLLFLFFCSLLTLWFCSDGHRL